MKIVNGEPMYEVGDMVTIVSRDRFPQSRDTHVGVAGGMLDYCGRRRIISKVEKRGWGYVYELEGSSYAWENKFFEPIFELSKDTGGSLSLDGIDEFISMFTIMR